MSSELYYFLHTYVFVITFKKREFVCLLIFKFSSVSTFLPFLSMLEDITERFARDIRAAVSDL
jgi:hypothetical protein